MAQLLDRPPLRLAPPAAAAELAALVDVLLPGDGLFPPAASVGVQWYLAERLRAAQGEAGLGRLQAALAAAGGPLTGLAPAARIGVVEQLAEHEPALFADLREASYLGYYQAPAVHAAIRTLGHRYRASPQPDGYALPPFEPARDAPRVRRGHYRATAEIRPHA